MGQRRKLSEATITTAIAAVEKTIEAVANDNSVASDLNETQALYDARRELLTLGATPPKAPSTRATRNRRVATPPAAAIRAAD